MKLVNSEAPDLTNFLNFLCQLSTDDSKPTRSNFIMNIFLSLLKESALYAHFQHALHLPHMLQQFVIKPLAGRTFFAFKNRKVNGLHSQLGY